MSDLDVNKWYFLKNLDKDFVKNIKYVYVFGINGNEVILISNDDNVYAFGNNTDGCLGVGHMDVVTQPTLIPELCQKQVTNFEFGAKNFVLAITKNGTIYSWGNNIYGQLCNGNKISQSKTIIIDSLKDKKVIAIKTGKIHSLALTSTGDVYRLGFNYTFKHYSYQTQNHEFVETKAIIYTASQNNKFISIACGLYHSLALTDNGDVYYWGNYSLGKSIDSYINLNSPYMSVTISDWYQIQSISEITMNKIVCGPYHGLLLSNKGNVYCFGDNNCGQCGDGSYEVKLKSTKVDSKVKFIDIGATKNYDISVGLADDGFCYVWGKCGDQTFNKPTKTKFNKINDVLAFNSSIRVTYAPLNLSRSQCSVKMDRNSLSFNQREYSDIAFKVENKSIYAHKSYLSFVSKYFEVMFADKNWIESNKYELEIKGYKYSVYYAFIRYLYTDCVDIKAEDSVELLDLANCYLDEELKKSCVQIIKNLISNENLFSIYCTADKYNSEELKECCIKYFSSINNESNAKIILENAVKLVAN